MFTFFLVGLFSHNFVHPLKICTTKVFKLQKVQNNIVKVIMN